MGKHILAISTLDDLKNSSATMGMVLFSLMSGSRPDERINGFVDAGLAICDIVTKRPTLASSGLSNYRDFANAEAFRALDRKKRSCPDKLAGLESEAQIVRQTLEKLRAGEDIANEELNTSASFFSSIYRAM